MPSLNLAPDVLKKAEESLPDFAFGAVVGILGASFNPAHCGHLHVAKLAKTQLNLAHVLLIPARANPLKSADSLAVFAARLASAQKLAQNAPWLSVSNIEQVCGLIYSIDLVRLLQKLQPETRFVWLMGADGFVSLPQWRDWRALLSLVPFAIAPRHGWTQKAQQSEVAHLFRDNILAPAELGQLPQKSPPALGFLEGRALAISASKLREAGEGL